MESKEEEQDGRRRTKTLKIKGHKYIKGGAEYYY